MKTSVTIRLAQVDYLDERLQAIIQEWTAGIQAAIPGELRILIADSPADSLPGRVVCENDLIILVHPPGQRNKTPPSMKGVIFICSPDEFAPTVRYALNTWIGRN